MAPVSTPSPRTNTRGLIPVAVKTLQSMGQLDVDLFLWPCKDQAPLLYREKQLPLEAVDLQRLLNEGIDTIYTRSADAQNFGEQFRKHVLLDESVSVADRYTTLKEATRAVLMSSLTSGDVSTVVNVSAGLGRDMVSLICDRQGIMADLLSVMTHDYYTFTHITNVCTCCLVLAEGLGIRDQSELNEIAQGALLHDLGKRLIPSAILNKPGKLTDEEFAIIKLHPTRGFEELCLRPDLSWGQLMMVYQHHEKMEGGGYPCGLVGEEIHPWGRMCAVVDVYDALARDRPYRQGMSLSEINDFMERSSGRSFDKEICECWMSILNQCQP